MIKNNKNKKILVLDNIRSVLNVGAIFRTSDAIGIDKIYLCGYTPTPIDRFGRARKDIAKSALGAEKTINWESCENTVSIIEKLKKEKFIICSLEQDKKSTNYKDFSENKSCKENIVIVLGNEVNGVDKKVLNLSDYIVEIPMKGDKESLNVSVSAGILLYQLFDK